MGGATNASRIPEKKCYYMLLSCICNNIMVMVGKFDGFDFD